MFTRRSLILAFLALFGLGVDEALAARRRRRTRPAPRRTRPAAARRAAPVVPAGPVKPVPPKPMLGRPLPIPAFVTAGPGAPYTLSARPTLHAPQGGLPIPAFGFGGAYGGPVIAVRRDRPAVIRVENALTAPLTWSVPTLPGVAPLTVGPGDLGELTLNLDQPASLHPYIATAPGAEGGSLAQAGLSGVVVVLDADAATLPLPSRWGVDDLLVVLNDATFDALGQPVEADGLGARVLANGVTDAVATVAKSLVRLRLINAANERVFRLYFEDETPFYLIATDGGFLTAPVALDIVRLAPGERAEILVDLSEGFPARLMTTPDNRERRLPGVLVDEADQNQSLVQVLGLDPQWEVGGVAVRPVALAAARPVRPAADAPRRQLSLGPRTTAAVTSGATDAAASVERWPVTAGSAEIWRLEGLERAETIRVEGARIAVFSEAGGPPQPWNSGLKDTVFVDRVMEIAIVFDRPTPADRPARVLRLTGRGVTGAQLVRLVDVRP